MKKSELAVQVAEACDLSDPAGVAAVDAVFQIIADALIAGDRVALPQFGTFEIKERPARTGRNFRTGEVMDIPVSKTITFKPASHLKTAFKKDDAS